ncbi:MAG: hypothetical protein ACI39R_08925 [Lachnospiraceae bacterium]
MDFSLQNNETSSPRTMVLHDQIFSVEILYGQVEKAAHEKSLSSTLQALPLMKKYHEGQTRKGPGNVPFIYHPLTMAVHALALGIENDNILSAILLHDVCEDCGIAPDELPVNKDIQKLVDILTYTELPGESEDSALNRYFKRISENTDAMLIKIIDRCNNIASMAAAFTPEHMISYIYETENYVLPLLEDLKENGKYNKITFVLEYHMLSILESLKHMIALLGTKNS